MFDAIYGLLSRWRLATGLAVLMAIFVCGCVKFEPQTLNPAQLRSEFYERSLNSESLKEFLQTYRPEIKTNFPVKVWDAELLALAALYYHPGLSLAKAQTEVARSGIISAGARPNPTVTALGGFNRTAAGYNVNPWLPSISFDFPLETAGKRSLRIAVASNLTEVARLNESLTRWEVRANVKSAYLELLSAHQRAVALEKLLAVQEKIRASMQKRIEAGEMSPSDLTSVLILIARSRVELGDAHRQYQEALPRLAAAIGVPVNSLKNVEFDFRFNYDTNIVSIFGSKEMIEKSLKTRPDLLSVIMEYETAQAQLQLEIAKQYPDVHISPGYEWDQGEHKWSIGLTIELPVFYRNQGQIAAAIARRNQMAMKFNAVQIKVLSDIDSAITSARAILEQIRKFDDLRIVQEELKKRLEAQVAAGAIDRASILNVELELATTEVALVEALIKWEKACVQLEQAFMLPFETVTQERQ